MTATTTTDAIPLNKLAAWHGNVRKTGADTGLAVSRDNECLHFRSLSSEIPLEHRMWLGYTPSLIPLRPYNVVIGKL